MEHSAVLLTCIKIPHEFRAFVLSFFEWPLKTGLEIIKPFSCSTRLSMKFQLLLKNKIPKNEEVSYFKSLRFCLYQAILSLSDFVFIKLINVKMSTIDGI